MNTYFSKFSPVFLALSIVLLFAGCSKSDSDPVYKDGCFRYADKTYNSLNAATKAALDNVNDEEAIIYLLDNVTDNEPLSLDSYGYDGVTFNLGGFTYVSANGLDFKNVLLTLSGEGSLECRNGALSSGCYIEVGEDFNGRITTPVTLDDAAMVVCSPKAEVNISELKFAEGGLFSMEAVSEKPASVVIEHLSHSDGCKVCAIDRESVLIRDGGKVHIHNYKLTNDVPANCCNAGYKTYKCEDCGEYWLEFKDGETGHCIVENLIHHAAVEPTDAEYGNLEYWECPFCGACYSDAEGKNSINPTLLPKNYDLPVDVLFACDDVLEQQNSAGSAIFGLLKDLISLPFEVSNEQLLTEMKNLSAKITQLSRDVAEIRNAINKLYSQVQNISIGRGLSDYSNRIVKLQNTTLKYYQSYEAILNEEQPLEKKKEKIDQLFEDFGKETQGMALDAELLSLLQFYCTNPSIEFVTYKNVPEAQAKFTQNIFLWEHLGYKLRTGITLTDFQGLSSSYFIINTYLKWTGKPQDLIMMQNLKESLDKCTEVMKADEDDMKDRDSKYRIYSGNGSGQLVFYEKEYYNLGTKLQDWFDNSNNTRNYYFPRAEAQKETAIRSCEKILEDAGLADGFMEHSHLNATYDKYKDRIGRNTTDGVLSFIGFPKMREAYTDYFICEANGADWYNYGHINNDVTLPYYKIFQWYKWKGRSAYFKVRTINLPDRPTGQLDWLYLRNNMGMWASDGCISNPGTKPITPYYTIRKLKDLK